AGLIALEQMPNRLHEDHLKARTLADGLSRAAGVSIEPRKVATNIVIFDIGDTGMTTAAFAAELRIRGVLVSVAGATRIRMVTHLDVTAEDCDVAVRTIEEVISASLSSKSAYQTL